MKHSDGRIAIADVLLLFYADGLRAQLNGASWLFPPVGGPPAPPPDTDEYQPYLDHLLGEAYYFDADDYGCECWS